MKRYILVSIGVLFLGVYINSKSAFSGSESAIGSGSFEIAGKTYKFDVLQCNLKGDTDPEQARTLYGSGKMPEGEKLSIFVDRNKIRGIYAHGIDIAISQPDGKSTYYSASRVSTGNTWVSEHGADEGPLIVIDGSTLTASGVFDVTNGNSVKVAGKGTLKATCNK